MEAERSERVRLLCSKGWYLSLWQPPCLKTTICSQTSWEIKYASLVSHDKSLYVLLSLFHWFVNLLPTRHCISSSIMPTLSTTDTHSNHPDCRIRNRARETINNWSALSSSVAHMSHQVTGPEKWGRAERTRTHEVVVCEWLASGLNGMLLSWRQSPILSPLRG